MKISFVTGKWVLSRERDNDANSGYVQKWKTWQCLENGQRLSFQNNFFYNFDLRK